MGLEVGAKHHVGTRHGSDGLAPPVDPIRKWVGPLGPANLAQIDEYLET